MPLDKPHFYQAVKEAAQELAKEIPASRLFLSELRNAVPTEIDNIFKPTNFNSPDLYNSAKQFIGDKTDIKDILNSFVRCHLDAEAPKKGLAGALKKKIGKFSHGKLAGEYFQIKSDSKLREGLVFTDRNNTEPWTQQDWAKAKTYCFRPSDGALAGSLCGALGGGAAAAAVVHCVEKCVKAEEVGTVDKVSHGVARLLSPFVGSVAGAKMGVCLAGLQGVAMAPPILFYPVTGLAGTVAGFATGVGTAGVCVILGWYLSRSMHADTVIKQIVKERRRAGRGVSRGPLRSLLNSPPQKKKKEKDVMEAETEALETELQQLETAIRTLQKEMEADREGEKGGEGVALSNPQVLACWTATSTLVSDLKGRVLSARERSQKAFVRCEEAIERLQSFTRESKESCRLRSETWEETKKERMEKAKTVCTFPGASFIAVPLLSAVCWAEEVSAVPAHAVAAAQRRKARQAMRWARLESAGALGVDARLAKLLTALDTLQCESLRACQRLLSSLTVTDGISCSSLSILVDHEALPLAQKDPCCFPLGGKGGRENGEEKSLRVENGGDGSGEEVEVKVEAQSQGADGAKALKKKKKKKKSKLPPAVSLDGLRVCRLFPGVNSLSPCPSAYAGVGSLSPSFSLAL